MDTIIAAPASCKVRAVIRFLHTEGQSAVEIHRRLCRVYGDNIMSDRCVREWCRKFRDGRTDAHDEGGQERHSICDRWTRSKSRPTLAWKTSFHDIRTFWRISTNFEALLCIELSRTDWVTISSVHGGYQKNRLTRPHNLAALFFEEGLQKLVSRYKCLNADDNYVEK